MAKEAGTAKDDLFLVHGISISTTHYVSSSKRFSATIDGRWRILIISLDGDTNCKSDKNDAPEAISHENDTERKDRLMLLLERTPAWRWVRSQDCRYISYYVSCSAVNKFWRLKHANVVARSWGDDGEGESACAAFENYIFLQLIFSATFLINCLRKSIRSSVGRWFVGVLVRFCSAFNHQAQTSKKCRHNYTAVSCAICFFMLFLSCYWTSLAEAGGDVACLLLLPNKLLLLVDLVLH